MFRTFILKRNEKLFYFFFHLKFMNHYFELKWEKFFSKIIIKFSIFKLLNCFQKYIQNTGDSSFIRNFSSKWTTLWKLKKGYTVIIFTEIFIKISWIVDLFFFFNLCIKLYCKKVKNKKILAFLLILVYIINYFINCFKLLLAIL